MLAAIGETRLFYFAQRRGNEAGSVFNEAGCVFKNRYRTFIGILEGAFFTITGFLKIDNPAVFRVSLGIAGEFRYGAVLSKIVGFYWIFR